MSLKVDIEKRQEGFYIVILDGRLDTETYCFCEEKLAPLLDACTKVLMLDMKNLNYISSMGLRVILKARKSIEKYKGRLIMTNLQPQIAKIFEIAKALPSESIFTSVEEADKYFDVMQRREIEKQNGPTDK